MAYSGSWFTWTTDSTNVTWTNKTYYTFAPSRAQPKVAFSESDDYFDG